MVAPVCPRFRGHAVASRRPTMASVCVLCTRGGGRCGACRKMICSRDSWWLMQITGKKMHSTLWYLQHSPA